MNKKQNEKVIKIIEVLIVTGMLTFGTIVPASYQVVVYAHSGRTDSSGGHKDNKNKSGLGSYHYHCGGYPAYLHEGRAK